MRSDLILINTFLSTRELGIYSAAKSISINFPSTSTTAISTVFLKEASSITRNTNF